ncbi:DoxX family membrane protein [candidate division GN15 bacterium]|nr:DoxX family membrane protein [candidate division GN15 bacterium]
MRAVIDNDYLTMLSRLVVGGMFIYASFYKIIEPASFAKSIWYYHMVPGSLINLMALILPWLEFLCGIGLIVGVLYRGAALWLNALLVIFIVALASTIVRGIDIDCGCFKAAESATDSAWSSLIRNIVLLVLGVQMLLSRSQRWQLMKDRTVPG